MNGNVLQRNISKVFPNKIAATSVEILFLFLMGVLAMLIHAKLRIPMHLPGKNGLLFMMIVVSSCAASRFSFGASLTCFGSASLLMFANLGFDDPFMPIVYILLGVFMDLIFGISKLFKSNVFIVAIASGFCWMLIPLIRSGISLITGFPYQSLLGGVAYPLFTHFIFGLLGGLIGAGLVYFANKTQN
ncbi:MAG: hypothetical protein HY951_17980 [Bacteroidia bacterium]|nr:hypothetical protein [Bacteroidia bacterium]